MRCPSSARSVRTSPRRSVRVMSLAAIIVISLAITLRFGQESAGGVPGGWSRETLGVILIGPLRSIGRRSMNLRRARSERYAPRCPPAPAQHMRLNRSLLPLTRRIKGDRHAI